MFRSILCLAFVGYVCAAAGSWKQIDSDVLTTDLGVAFINEFVGYTAGDANGIGPVVLKSIDGGAHFEQCNATFGIDILLLDTDATENSVVVSSVFGELYSADGGATFRRSTGGGTSQSVRFIGQLNSTNKYACAGQYGSKEGVALSLNGGASFKIYDAHLYTWSRYGAFPNDTHWYVAAGQWPDSEAASPLSKDKKFQRPLKNRRSVFLGSDNSYLYPVRQSLGVQATGWFAQIAVTRDGGKTFTTVFSDNSTFYFNGIDCSPNNGDNCCAVGEGDDGARIHCTTDGGNTWNRTFWAPAAHNQGYSLLELRFASDTEAWAVGAVLSTAFPSAWFLHTTDGGKTWNQEQAPVRAFYAMSVSMVSANVGYVAADNLITQESSIFKYTTTA